MFICLGPESNYGEGKTLAEAWKNLQDNVGISEEEFDFCSFHELNNEIKVERVTQVVPKPVAITKSTTRHKDIRKQS